MKLRALLSVLALSAALMVPALASAAGLEIAVGFWRANPSGDFMYKGDSLNLEEDLGMIDESKFIGRARLELPSILPNIYLMATPMAFEGNSVNTFRFADQNFTASTKSKLELDHYDLALFYGIPAIKELSGEKVNIDLGINARYLDINAEVSQSLPALQEKKSIAVVVPMLFAAIQIRPSEHIAFEFEGRGVAYSGNQVFDAIGRIKFIPLEVFFIAGGYRYERYKVDVSDLEADMSFQGAFLEAGLEF